MRAQIQNFQTRSSRGWTCLARISSALDDRAEADSANSSAGMENGDDNSEFNSLGSDTDRIRFSSDNTKLVEFARGTKSRAVRPKSIPNLENILLGTELALSSIFEGRRPEGRDGDYFSNYSLFSGDGRYWFAGEWRTLQRLRRLNRRVSLSGPSHRPAHCYREAGLSEPVEIREPSVHAGEDQRGRA